MQHRRRPPTAFILAVMMATLVVSPAGAASTKPATKAPSFAVTLSTTDAATWLAPKIYLPFTFTSTSTSTKTTTGFARFVAPSPPIPAVPGNHGWKPALQQADPLARGYFRVEATTCASATVYAFTPSADGSEQSIEIAFDCQPGQAFVLHWFPTSEYQGFDFPNYDVWQFPVATRLKVKDGWTPQTPPQLRVHPVNFLDIINIPFIKPPVKLVEVAPVPSEPEAPQTWLLTGNGYIDIMPVQQTVTVTTAYRADTGAELIIANPEGLRLEQTTIQVVSCLDLDGTVVIDGEESVVDIDCTDLDLVVEIDRPGAGIFQNIDETALSQTTVLVNVDAFSTTPVNWDKAGTECRYRGGNFLPAEPGISTNLWICDFVDLSDITRYNDAKAVLRGAEYCPTGVIRDDPVTIANRDVVCVS